MDVQDEQDMQIYNMLIYNIDIRHTFDILSA